MKIRILLLSALAFLAAIPAGAIHDDGFRIDPDPLTGPDAFRLSWIAKEGFLYTLIGSETLHGPWIPLAQEADLEDDELAQWGFETDSDRFFMKLLTEEDNGIRIFARCEAGKGVLLEVDVSGWVSQNPGASIGEFTIERATSPEGPFSTVGETLASGLDANHRLEYVDKTADQDATFYYRTWFTYILGGVLDVSPYSNVAYVHTVCPQPGGAKLLASCRSDRIVLKWQPPEWAHPQDEIDIQYWSLMRSTDPQGPYSEIPLEWDHFGTSRWFYVDTAVLPEITYHYYVSFQFTDGGPFNPVLTSAKSNVAAASMCDEPPFLGPLDVAFVWDNTASVTAPLERLKTNPGLIDVFLNGIQASSGGDYRLALVSTDADIVNVRLNFTDDRSEFKTALQNLPLIGGGHNNPESTDECLNTVVNGLRAADRDPNAVPPEVQIGDFDPPFGRSPTGGTWLLGDVSNETNPLAFDISPGQLEAELGLLWNVNSVTGVGGGEYLVEFSTAPNELFGDGSALTPESEVVVRALDATSYLVQLEQKTRKVVVLLTDDHPGGFDDPLNWSYEVHALRALGYAHDAAEKGIRINAIMVDSGSSDVAASIMLDYAGITDGWYSKLGFSGDNLEDAILSFVYEDWVDNEP